MTVLWPNGGTTPPNYYRDVSSGFRWTSAFGVRTHPVTGALQSFHYGLDMIGWSTIVSPVNGVVTFAGYNGGAGNEVRIRADNGDVFRLLHNRELWVRTNQRVSQGQGVAVMGTTGQSTGVHCHEETRPGGGVAINPMTYYANANARPSGGGGQPIEQPKKASNIMIHAAWRHPNGSIAVQCVPGGRITQLQDPYDWLGMVEAGKVGMAQLTAEQYNAIIARYGTVPYPTFDTGAPASQLAVVIPMEGGASRYFMVGERLFPLRDIGTMGKVEAQGVPYFTLPQEAIDKMLEK